MTSNLYIKRMKAFREGASFDTSPTANPLRIDENYGKKTALRRDLTRYYEECIVSESAKRIPRAQRKSYCAGVAWKRARVSGKYDDYPGFHEAEDMAKKKKSKSAKSAYSYEEKPAKKPKHTGAAKAKKKPAKPAKAKKKKKASAAKAAQTQQPKHGQSAVVTHVHVHQEKPMAAKKSAKKKKAAKKKTGAAYSAQSAPKKKKKSKKLSGKAKAEFLARMAKGRAKSEEKPKKKRKKKAAKATAAPRHTSPKKKAKKKSRSITVAGVTRKRTSSGKTRTVPSTINIRLSPPRNVPKKKKKAKHKAAHHHHHHMAKQNPIYAMENPLSGGELALAVVTGTVGFMLADVVDRIMATNAATAQTTQPVLDNTIAVLSPPNWKRMAAGAAFALVPFALTLVPSVKESGMAVAALQGAGLGALLNIGTRIVNTMVIPAVLKNNTTYGPRLYGPEIAANSAAAALSTTPYSSPTAIPAPGTISGLPGLGAFRQLPRPRYADHGPVARAGVGAMQVGAYIPPATMPGTFAPPAPAPAPVATSVPGGCGPSGSKIADAAAQAYYASQQLAAQNMISELQHRGAGSTMAPGTDGKENCGCGTLGMTPSEMFPED